VRFVTLLIIGSFDGGRSFEKYSSISTATDRREPASMENPIMSRFSCNRSPSTTAFTVSSYTLPTFRSSTMCSGTPGLGEGHHRVWICASCSSSC